ncbi:MAG: phosphoglucosamine mutase [Actinomycetota bacterium]|nr:phosphoglucosamine mutase [Actinomycetota bacterium]
MARAHFGTDGVRGVANAELTPELVLALGRAASVVFPAPAFVVGRDTRRSGPMLQAALAAGIASEGADVLDAGVLPTPAIAWLAWRDGLPGAVVSASHNPFADNGVKLFGPGGTKLDHGAEAAVEAELARLLDPGAPPRRRPEGPAVGRVVEVPGAADDYVDHLVTSVGPGSLAGLSVVVDCANGAASGVAARAFSGAGATVATIGCDPDGDNINDGCGSTDPARLGAAVTEHGADLGLALDGDADRLVAVDHTGTTVDGDQLLALFAIDLAGRGGLVGNAVVVTVMTNLGFRLAMAERGIGVHETPVGDRHVLAALEEGGLVLGGEQSGHIVFRDRATTGDGLLTGLVLAELVRRSGRPLAALVDGLVERVPQVLVNVAVPDARLLEGCGAVWSAVAEEEDRLGDQGRVLLRPSGTEPVVRVMVEAHGDGVAAEVAGRLAALVGEELRAAAPPS